MTSSLFRGVLAAALTLLCTVPGAAQPDSVVRSEFKVYFEESHVEGSFILFDMRANRAMLYNPHQLTEAFTPASTFKICNSLIGVETGVIKDADFVIPWDSVPRWRPEWNRDHNLRSAFRNSTVWYYQELARRVGGERMKHWLDTVPYGNADTSGGIDQFWLSGGLRITPRQQIDFLVRLHRNDLPFAQRTMDIVKEIMIADSTSQYVLRAKTGWNDQGGKQVGWYVGYVVKQDGPYFFASCIQSPDPNHPLFGAARDIAMKILRKLRVLPD